MPPNVANDLQLPLDGAMVHRAGASPGSSRAGLRGSRAPQARRVPTSRPRPQLPAELVAAPRSTCELRAAGVSAEDLAGPLWTPALRGVHVWLAATRLDPATRIEAVVAAMPAGAALGGWASLCWLGLEALDGRTGPGASTDLPVTVCTGPVGRMRQRAGIDIDRSTILDVDLVEHRGVLVTRPARSVVDVARRLGPEEGLVAADAALRSGLLTRLDVDDALSRLVRIKRVPQARLVAALADPRAESPTESRLRYAWVVEAGLPIPLVNAVIAGPDGVVIGRADLLDDEAGLVGEYDGADHRELTRHTSDNAREEGFEELNLTVARATAIDLWPRRRALVQRLRARRATGLARDRRRDRWQVLAE